MYSKPSLQLRRSIRRDVSARAGIFPTELGGEEFAQDVIDGLGIAVAAGGFHALADEKFEDAFVAGFEFSDVVGILGDDFTGGLLDGAIADLGAEAFGGNNLGGGAAGVEHGCEN